MNKDASMHIVFRPYRDADQGFVYSTWIKGMFFGNAWDGGHQSEPSFHRKYAAVVQSILTNPKTAVTVAVLKEDPDVILGYAVTDPESNVLHWVYVKPTWRRLGLAKHMIPTTTTVITHMTNWGRSLAPKSWKYDPFMI